MTTWSDWIPLKSCQYPDDAEVQLGPRSRFRVKIGPDGWSDGIGWEGGDCPVPRQMPVMVYLRNGESHEDNAGDFYWSYHRKSTDIIAFKVQAAEPAPAKQGSYYVSVVGMSAPTKAHDTLESAIAEAQRLGKQPANAQRDVQVFQLVATLPPAERRVVMVGEGV